MACRILHSTKFSGSVCYPNCIQWSENNKLAVCVDKGVYVLTSSYIPFESEFPITLHHQEIPAPEETLSFDVKVNREVLHLGLQTDDIHSMMLDHTLSPLTENSPLFLTFKCARWSPKDVFNEGCCSLAVLTMDHRLKLYKEVKNKWVPLVDLSLKFYNQHKEIWEKDKLEETSETRDTLFMFKQMKERTYKLAAITMTWTQRFEPPAVKQGNECLMFCFLIVAMKSGHIIFWKVAGTEMIEVVAEWDSKLGYISSLFWQQTGANAGFLVLGANTGLIVLLPVCITTEGEELQFGENITIWNDADQISVSQIIVMKQSEWSYAVLATKDIHIISCEVLVKDCNVTVAKIGHTTGLHNLAASGLCKVGNEVPQSQLLLSSIDGRIISLTVSVMHKSVLIEQEELDTGVETDKFSPQGICCSQNGSLFVVFYNIPTMFDYHVTKEPLKLVIFTLNTIEEICNKLMKKTDAIKKTDRIARATYAYQFSQLFDYIISLNAQLMLGFDMPTSMKDLLDDPLATEHRLVRLQLIRHIAKISMANSLPTDKQFLQAKCQLEKVESLIMKHYIIGIIGAYQVKLQELSSRQRLSLLLMNDWLVKKYHIVVNGIYTALGENIPVPAEIIPCREKCAICKTDILLEQYQYGICSNSHKFGRCCKSLLLCDMMSYRKCNSCNVLAAFPPVWPADSFCTFCNSAMR